MVQTNQDIDASATNTDGRQVSQMRPASSQFLPIHNSDWFGDRRHRRAVDSHKFTKGGLQLHLHILRVPMGGRLLTYSFHDQRLLLSSQLKTTDQRCAKQSRITSLIDKNIYWHQFSIRCTGVQSEHLKGDLLLS